MRRAGHAGDVTTTAGTRVDPTLGTKPRERALVVFGSLRLFVRPVAWITRFVPVESEPLEVSPLLVRDSRHGSAAIEILDAKHESSFRLAGAKPSHEKRPGMAQMQSSGRRRGQPSAIPAHP